MTGAGKIRRVCLTGFMGAGKTTVGQTLAQRLGWKFHDLDTVIESRERKTIAAIFAASGEAGFRRIESAALQQLLEQDSSHHSDCVIALGGGTFVQPQNRALLERCGATAILLDASLDELRRRCRQDGSGRPLAQDEAGFKQLLASRHEAYRLAQFRVDTTGKTPEQVAAEIEGRLGPKELEVKQ